MVDRNKDSLFCPKMQNKIIISVHYTAAMLNIYPLIIKHKCCISILTVLCEEGQLEVIILGGIQAGGDANG